MIKVPCRCEDGKIEEIEVPETIFNRSQNKTLIHQVVISYLANARNGTRAQKDRSEVAGTTRKQWRQKGTGRARTSSAKNPIWRGGGKIFPNKPTENFQQKLNRKMYRSGMCSIFSELLRDQRLVFIDKFQVDMAKTKSCVEKLKKYNLHNAVIIINEIDANLYLASRNIPNIKIIRAKSMDPISLLSYETVVVTSGTINTIENVLQ